MEETEIRPGVMLKHHGIELCINEHCPIHNPSDHNYRAFPLDYDFKRQVMVRILDDGTKIIDPDDYRVQQGGILRNSFKCKGCFVEVVSTHRHDFAACACGNFTDGGNVYIRRGGNFEDMVDTSITAKAGMVLD